MAPEPSNPPNADSTRGRGMHPALLIGVTALFIAYALLSHYSSVSPDGKSLGAALSIGPVFLVGAVLLWRWTHPVIAVMITAAVGTLMFHYRDALEAHYAWADLVEQCGAYALVGVSFARSLFGNRVPLCTHLATELHGSLAPIEVEYLRRITWVWAVFYFLLAVVIGLLFFVVALHVWSFFVNFVTFGLIAIVCLADYAVRRHALPRRKESAMIILQRMLFG